MVSRKRKNPKSEPFVVDLIEKIITAQSKSDEKMLELEEKRMRMEERQLEREDKQRRDDRLFQMQMMKIMGPGAYHFPPPSNHPSLGQSNSSGQSSHSSTFAFGSPNMYDYSSDFANQQ